MIFRIVTLFPDFFESPLQSGLVGKAIDKAIIQVELINLRDFSSDRFRHCDDAPYGGGDGMVLMAEPLFKCMNEKKGDSFTILTTPAGTPLSQEMVKKLRSQKEICIICGHYEGVDQRVSDKFVDAEISIGDYVLSGGEYAALVIMDAVSRYVPGFMGNSGSLEEESFEEHLLEYPQYTRPAEIEGMKVPEILLSGHHANIQKWRREQRIEKTKRIRPDLYKRFSEQNRGEEQ
ncbi:MAG: tRNA (guanosine(37)-N1)-methyltransferase TrmD [Spirochaetota bacterium]